MHDDAPAHGTRRRARGALLLVTSIATAGLSWLTLRLLADALQKNPDAVPQLSASAQSALNNRNALPLLAIPAVLAAIMIFTARMRAGLAWVLTIFAMLWIVGCIGLMMYVFLSIIAPLYQYHPL